MMSLGETSPTAYTIVMRGNFVYASAARRRRGDIHGGNSGDGGFGVSLYPPFPRMYTRLNALLHSTSHPRVRNCGYFINRNFNGTIKYRSVRNFKKLKKNTVQRRRGRRRGRRRRRRRRSRRRCRRLRIRIQNDAKSCPSPVLSSYAYVDQVDVLPIRKNIRKISGLARDL